MLYITTLIFVDVFRHAFDAAYAALLPARHIVLLMLSFCCWRRHIIIDADYAAVDAIFAAATLRYARTC